MRILRREDGFAMVTALLAITVASILGVTVMSLSLHTSQMSAYDRARMQAIHAAEAGIDTTLATLETSSTLPCTITGTSNGSPSATYSVTITYYDAFPLTGTPITCVSGYVPSTTLAAGAVLESIGSVTGWAPKTVERQMESEVELSPVRGAFNKAIFSNQTPQITNSITIYGDNGNNADFVTNGSWNCSNTITVYGSIYVQGTATLGNSCRALVDLWANGAVSLSNSARVDHDLKSSTGNLTMTNNSSVGNNVTIGGSSCTGCSTRVAGTITTGNVQPAPPAATFPAMTFDAGAWTDAGYTIGYFTDCATAKAWILDSANAGTKEVLRITGGCTLSFTNNTTITRTADLAIFTDGEISTSQQTTWQSGDGSWHNLFLIVESAASCAGTDGRITMSNQTGFDKLYFFVYSPCYSTFAQNNSSSRGQVYGNVVAAANNMSFTFHAMLVPGAGDVTGFSAETQFLREVN